MEIDSNGYQTKVLGMHNRQSCNIHTKNNLGKAQEIGSNGYSLAQSLPCDAKYLIRKNNISFKGKNDIKRVSQEELEKIKNEASKKAKELGIDLGMTWDMGNKNIPIQLTNLLLNHKIIENESVKDNMSHIILSISQSSSCTLQAKELLNFSDFITSDEVKDVYNNESVSDRLGQILLGLTHNNSLQQKIDIVRYINQHKEILNKGINLGEYIEKVDRRTYEDYISELHKTNPSEIPPESNNTNTDCMLKEKTEKLGRVATKDPKGISGFDRIGGQNEAITQLKRAIIFPRRYPQLYAGRNTEKGAILYGPPGTGKSLMATAFAEEYGAYFIKIAATEMQNKYVGETEENWRNLFEELKENQPALLFIDEMDALCKKRGSGDIHGDKELNQFLKLVSDIKAENLDVFILGATNNFDALDPAVLRDGRFGLHIEMLPPQSLSDVKEIFDIHTKNHRLDKDVQEQEQLIHQTILDVGLTGSGIEALVNNAHDNALERLGLFEKMENNTVTEEDLANFSIKAEDFIKALSERQKDMKKGTKQCIGFHN